MCAYMFVCVNTANKIQNSSTTPTSPPHSPRNCPTLSLFAVSPLSQATMEVKALYLSSY